MKPYKNPKTGLVFIVIITMFMVTLTSGKTIYVDDDATGANSGTSWDNAYIYLQDALADANDSEKPVEIRVAQGIYTPDKGVGIFIDDIEAAFNLINGVTISGGYAGIDANEPDARDVMLYETILSGDLLGNDEPVAEPCDLFPESEQDSRYDNSYNVVTAINTDETAVLDGFTITGGIASEDYLGKDPKITGGGLYCSQSSPMITNCKFTFNAAWNGGAMHNLNSSPTLINCRFENNAAIKDKYFNFGGSGGAMLNFNSSPVLSNCMFAANFGGSGTGIYNYGGNPVLTDCIFAGNRANNTGGGMLNSKSSPVLTGCTFEANIANSGGGMHNTNCNLILTGCTFIGNFSDTGGGMFNKQSEPNLTNCTFISNTANSGGAISNESCLNSVINNCSFKSNSARFGGAIENYNGNSTITGCSFTGNSAQAGGGMENWFSNLTISKCLLTGNAAEQGCALQNYSSELTLTNCTISGNAARIYIGLPPQLSSRDEAAGGTTDTGQDNNPDVPPPPGYPDDFIPDVNLYPSSLEYTNCIVWDDEDTIRHNGSLAIVISYSDIQGGWDGLGNIDEEPLFAEPGYWADVNDPNIIIDQNEPNAVWFDGDYHLKSQAGRFDPNSGSFVADDMTSPCIDAGEPGSPFADEPQPNGGRINIGAYGGTKEAGLSLPEI